MPERMDDPSLDAAEHEAALCTLNRMNRWLGIDRRLACEVAGVVSRNSTARDPGNEVSILELGAGGGSLMQYLNRVVTLTKGGVVLRRFALDISHRAMSFLRLHVPDTTIRAIAADARRLPLSDRSIDVVTCSLLLHHFDPSDVNCILRESMRVARMGIVIGDLTRSRTALILTWLTTRLTSRSRVVHIDGPLSVHAAFTPAELAAIARQAGMDEPLVQCQFPFRMMLIWRRSARGTESGPIR
jgi:2-polyprenyl-3-methyl-5-hydroxy-6-metoxy-1,4-benzoquinol methylase